MRVVDMTPFFCTSSTCPPVTRGAPVSKDNEHITDVYATTPARTCFAIDAA